MKILKKVLLGLILLVLLVCIGGYLWFRTTVPDYEGSLSLKGLQSEVNVTFDDYGVPHIEAQNAHDAYMALGYVHAQDRLFQMEMLRRLAGGRLSEVLGKDLLEVDKLFRTLGLNKWAAKNAEDFIVNSKGEDVDAALAYLEGINSFVSEGKKPIEFTLIGIPLTPFTPEDMFMTAGYMAFSFAEGMRVDPVMEMLETKYPGYAQEAFGSLSENFNRTNKAKSFQGTPVSISNAMAVTLNNALEKIPVPLMIGSNAWVLSGQLTKSGKPILANDTHIGFAQPAVWYEAALSYPGFSFYGHHIAGVPFGVLGNNSFCAWGITMFENDDMDFYREKTDPNDSTKILFGTALDDDGQANFTSSPMEIREEVIKVKDEKEFRLTVRTTPHGPVLNGLAEGVEGSDPISLWWTFLQQPVGLIKSFYNLNHAGSIEEARNAVSGIAAPGLNIVYADTLGNIAWWAAGRLPVRTEDQILRSRRFLDGAAGSDEHNEFYPFDKNPQAINPPWGYLHTGNNQPDSVDGVLYPGYYYPIDRAGRIEDLIRLKKDWTAEEVIRMQLDDVSITAPLAAKEMAGLTGEKTLSEILNNWNGAHGPEDNGPSVYYNMLSQIIYLAMADEIGADVVKQLVATSVPKGWITNFIKNDSSRWWDNVKTSEKETRQDIFKKAAERTLVNLRVTCGIEPSDWKWNKVHTLKHAHPLGAVKMLDQIFSVGPFPVPGGNEVINNLMFDLDTTGVFEVKAGPALRKVHDLTDLKSGWTVSPTGQSGVLGSPFYGGEGKLFAEGGVREMNLKGKPDQGRVLRLIPTVEK
jgi:penicillin amidase